LWAFDVGLPRWNEIGLIAILPENIIEETTLFYMNYSYVTKMYHLFDFEHGGQCFL
jgi:hypothetical protein